MGLHSKGDKFELWVRYPFGNWRLKDTFRTKKEAEENRGNPYEYDIVEIAEKEAA